MFSFNNRQTQICVSVWLALCCLMVFSMMLLGAAVRLTGSGLSMVQWQPILGTLPPLNLEQWQTTFDLYRQYPEYQLINRGMSLHEFKFIFYMEYAHRLLGRLIGLVFFIPMVFFLWRKKLSTDFTRHLFLLLALGALQGVVGWYMVKSGLVDNPRVSQYRLVLHLSIAMLIYAYMIFLLTRLWVSAPVIVCSRLRRFGQYILPLLLFITLLSGGFVAGTKAGFIYNTFPTMAGDWVPPSLLALTPAWLNFFDNPAAVQWLHRLLALTMFVVIVGYSALLLRTNSRLVALLARGLLLVVAIQVSLGIATLLLRVPPLLGVLHQAGAMALLALTITLATVFAYAPRQREKRA